MSYKRKTRSDKNKGRPRVKFNTPYKLSGNCKNCTKEELKGRHSCCFNINCICPHHVHGAYFATEEFRKTVLRTQAKPGDFDYGV